MTYQGSCHCGKVAYEVDAEISEVTACNCSICESRGYLLAFLPGDKVTIRTPESDMRYYTFNTHKIKHYFCPDCGSATFGKGADGKGNLMVAVNVRTLKGMDIQALKVKHFDGRKL